VVIPPKQSDLYTTKGVTISRVPTVDPATGRQTRTTVIGTEEGVGNGAPLNSVPAAGPTVGAMEQERWAKSLPEGKTAVPVAGYLYFPKPRDFPKPSGRKDGVWELTMDGAAGRVKLSPPRIRSAKGAVPRRHSAKELSAAAVRTRPVLRAFLKSMLGGNLSAWQ
jgi:hypothetical protein